MTTVGAYEAKTRLSELLDRVARGETVTITRHGVPVATLVPAGEQGRRSVAELVEELHRLRRGVRRGDLSIQEMLEEGRL